MISLETVLLWGKQFVTNKMLYYDMISVKHSHMMDCFKMIKQ